MTALSGLASNFIHLFLARMGVGIGEAGGVPPSHSVISDYFPPRERSTAIAIFSLGIPGGILFGYLAGGWLAANLGWRETFFVVGLPGIIVALLLRYTVREPSRGASENRTNEAKSNVPWTTVVSRLWKTPSYRTVVYGGALNAFCGYALAMWLVDFLVRSHGFAPSEVGVPLALVNGVGVGIGIYLGGKVSDRFAVNSPARYLLVPGWAFAIAAPLMVAAFFVPSATISLVLLFISFVLIYMSVAPFFTVIQTLAPLNNRALATAYFLLWQNLIGAGLGPFIMGGMSDVLHQNFGESDALRLALSSLGLITGVAAILLLMGAKSAAADFEKVRNQPV